MSFENLPHNKKSFKLLTKHEFETVLDIGSGKGNLFTQILIDNNKKVDSPTTKNMQRTLLLCSDTS